MDIRLRPASDARPELSIVLLDWSVRESFHSLDYLNQQKMPRSAYELIWVEYYDARPRGLMERLERAAQAGEPPPLDTWIALGMPRDCYYHKHLLYNVGLIASRGRIVTFCDSDAMFPEDFVERIVEAFREESRLVLHLDEVRSAERRFYPFNHPSFQEVAASRCLNLQDGRPAGAPRPGGPPVEDPLHTANYGACMCARREDLIAIGGADEHLDYLGHVCGPYDMTFRLVNAGCRERWHESAWIYHTWHPGAAGERNFVGPHDGRHMSTTALQARETGRVLPLVENPGVRALREAGVRPGLACAPLELAEAQGLAAAWSDASLSYQAPARDRRLAFLREHPAFAARLAARAAADAGSYGALVLRTSGLPHRRVPGDAGEGRRAALESMASAAHKLSKPLRRGRLPLQILRGVYGERRLLLARTRQCLEGLASERVQEVMVYGPDFCRQTVRAMAGDFGIRVVSEVDDVWGPEPAELARHPEAVALVAARHGLAHRCERLAAAGVRPPAIRVLEPAWLEAERAARPEPEASAGLALSIVVPTRGRPALARRLLADIHATAADPQSLEVLVCVDEDDPASCGIDEPGLQVRTLVLPPMTMGARTEVAFRHSRGQRVLLFNDDVEIRTPGWDRRIVEAFERFPDGIALVFGNDLHQRGANATFPVVSRETAGILGAVASPLLNHYHIESHLHDVFCRLRRLGHDRLVYLDDVVFQHYHPEGTERSQTARGRDDRVTFATLAEERESAARRLAARIADPERAAARCPLPAEAELRCLGSLAEQEPLLSIVVVEEAGRTGPVALPSDPGCSHEVFQVRSPRARRPALLRAAAEAARGRALVYLDAGTDSEPGWGRRALSTLDAGASAVWGPRVDPRHERVMRAGVQISASNGRAVLVEPERGRPRGAGTVEGDTSCAGLFGLVVERRRLLEVGGVPDGLTSDLVAGMDLCLRLKAHGLLVRRAPDLLWRAAEPGDPVEPAEVERVARAHGVQIEDGGKGAGEELVSQPRLTGP